MLASRTILWTAVSLPLMGLATAYGQVDHSRRYQHSADSDYSSEPQGQRMQAPTRIVNQPDFAIPLRVAADHPGNPVEIRLYVSSDRGSDWQLYQRRPLNADKFQFSAPRDGEYWFAVRTVDREGQLISHRNWSPELKVTIDTQRPRLDLRVTVDQQGHLLASWNAEDPNLAPHTFRLQHQDADGGWRDVQVPTPSAEDWRQQWEDQADWWVRNRNGQTQVRAEVLDRADNVAQVVKAVAVPRQGSAQHSPEAELSGPATSQFADPFDHGQDGSPDWQTEPVDPRNPDMRSGGNQPDDRWTHRHHSEPDPYNYTRRPLDNDPGSGLRDQFDVPSQTRQSSAGFEDAQKSLDEWTNWASQGLKKQLPGLFGGQATQGSATQGSATQGSATQGSATQGSATQGSATQGSATQGSRGQKATQVSADRDSRFGRRAEMRSENQGGHRPWSRPQSTLPPVRGPIHGQGNGNPQSTSPQSSPIEPPVANRGGLTDSSSAQSAIQPQFTANPNFALNYSVHDVGPDGPSSVELWLTRDRGTTWQRYGTDQDRQTPFEVELQQQGLYGFRLVVHGRTARSSTPQPGDAADIWVGVDWMKPRGRILDAHYVSGFKDAMVIEWQAEDAMLAERPITLHYATSPEGPWTAIVRSLRNSGSYSWQLDRRFDTPIYLQLEVRDLAGNVTTSQLIRPVSDNNSGGPRGVIHNLLEIGGGKATSALKPSTHQQRSRWR